MTSPRAGDTGTDAIAEEILRYLRAHPAATDSLDGIVDWWLPRQRYETAKADLESVLQQLVHRGAVEAVELADGSRLYRLPRRGQPS